MIRLPRKAFALFAGLVVIAAACGSSTVTAGPGGTSAAGATKAPAGASAAPSVNPNDPTSIIARMFSGQTTPKSFHIKIGVSGTIKAAALQGAGGTGAITSDLKLDGAVIEGDVDVANLAAHLSLAVPAMPALGNIPITGDVILAGGSLYYKVSLLGPKYTKTDLGSLTGGLTGGTGVEVPTAGPSALTGVEDQVAEIRKALDAAGAKTTLVGVEQVDGKDAYHINVSVPLDLINSQIAAAAESAAPVMKIDSASIGLWVYKDSYLPAKFEIKGASSSIGNLDLIVTVTNYDQPVTITAPPASEISTTAP